MTGGTHGEQRACAARHFTQPGGTPVLTKGVT